MRSNELHIIKTPYIIMETPLTLHQELVYKKALVEAKITSCKHEINYEDFCLICKEIID